jgi:hypothetical protein
VDGRAVYLTEAALPVFEGERQRTVDERRWATERGRWIRLAKGVKAPGDRRARIEGAPLSADVVGAVRTLYLTAAEREVRASRRARKWNEVAIIRREQAAALFEEAGSPVPPPDDVIVLHQEAANAALRAMIGIAVEADLVGATCCPVCRAEGGRTFRIADELRVPRLPHPGCPRGLCNCDWWVATEVPRRRRQRAKRGSAAATAGQDGISGSRGAPLQTHAIATAPGVQPSVGDSPGIVSLNVAPEAAVAPPDPATPPAN